MTINGSGVLGKNIWRNAPSGLDVDRIWNQYFLSYRTDIATNGIVLMAANDPDPNENYSIERENFRPKGGILARLHQIPMGRVMCTAYRYYFLGL